MFAGDEEEVFTTWSTDMDEADASLVCLCGELDASSASAFLTQVHGAIDRKRHILMDVHLLSYTDSTGIAAMLSIKSATEAAGKQMVLVGCHGLLCKLIDALQVGFDLPCYESLELAIEAVR